MPFDTTADAVYTTVASYTLGSGSLTVASVAGFPIPSPSAPILITAVRFASYAGQPETFGTYEATGLSGATLTGMTLIDGVDTAWVSGDIVEMRVCSKHFADLQTVATSNANIIGIHSSAIASIIASLNGVPTGLLKGVAGVLTTATPGADYVLPSVVTLASLIITQSQVTGLTAALGTFLTGNQTITLTGDTSGSGATAITTTTTKIGGKAVTLGGSLTTSGAFGLTITLTGATAVTLPTSGTLITTTVPTLANLTSIGGVITLAAGMQLGAPTGGDEGAGTLNVSGGYYVNGVLVAVGTAPNVQVFTSSGTWTKPTGATFCRVLMLGPGGGGGGGGVAASGTLIFGGGGGAGGAFVDATFRAVDLTATVTVTLGAAGTGGAGAPSTGATGTNGGLGGTSQFGTFATAKGGSQGNGGSTTSGAAFSGGGGWSPGGNGGAAGATTGVVGAVGIAGGASGGGGGGTISTTPAQFAGGGGAGADGFNFGVGVGGGAAGGGAGSPGTVSSALANVVSPGGGGAGGGSNLTGPGGNGGGGANYGGGGGGGGASLTSQGAGGTGGGGGTSILIVLSW